MKWFFLLLAIAALASCNKHDSSTCYRCPRYISYPDGHFVNDTVQYCCDSDPDCKNKLAAYKGYQPDGGYASIYECSIE